MSADAAVAKPLAILVGALGGQGGGVLAEWLVEAATRAGYPAQSTSIPGVAQRTGATTYYVEIFPVPYAELGGREPVLSLVPVPGAIDLLVASELLEAARMIQAAGLKGHALGGARVSEIHANFVVNPENEASASEIEMLIGRIQAQVHEKFGVVLVPEVRIVGERLEAG